MNYQELLQLIDKLDQSSVAYVEFKEGNHQVVLSKNAQSMASAIGKEQSVLDNDSLVIPTQTTSSVSQEQEKIMDTQEVLEEKGEPVLAPLVGVVYLQPKPDAEPYIQVGDTVKKGQVICLIEAMKLMNEIVATTDGVVTEILVENETVVEFNQPLVKIKA